MPYGIITRSTCCRDHKIRSAKTKFFTYIDAESTGIVLLKRPTSLSKGLTSDKFLRDGFDNLRFPKSGSDHHSCSFSSINPQITQARVLQCLTSGIQSKLRGSPEYFDFGL